MPPSQLKRLKASLREQGIVGPQKSKKEKKRAGKNDAARAAQRSQALAGIRESFNPFEIKAAPRPEKFQTTSLQKANGKGANAVLGRPGVTRSIGEETRRKTLLPEMNRRNKAGGIIDRRIGENDPTMSTEDKMLERFTREKSRKKGGGLFDLEDDDDELTLTHLGQSLDFGPEQDDFDAGSLSGGSDDENRSRLKRRRDSAEGAELSEEEGGEDQPERKKSKAEVMKEVIAKSKLHKYERQQQKEDDEELREELDKDMHDMLGLLRGVKKPQPPTNTGPAIDGALGSMDPARAALMSGADKAKAEKEYDRRLLEMKLDRRAAPTTRTKTEEEKAKEEAQRLKELEEKRMRRMRGEAEESDEEEEKSKEPGEPQGDDDALPDDAAEFGFADAHANLRPPGIDDEDDFVIDEDLIASGSDIDAEEVSSGSEVESSDEGEDPQPNEEEEEDEFVRGILGETAKPKGDEAKKAPEPQVSKLAYTYPCPRSHEELLDVLKGVSVKDTPTVVQRIRALYHPQLSAENKEKMADFCAALVDHISYMAMQKPAPPLAPVETLIRHLHSLSRTFPLGIAKAFRKHLEEMQQVSVITPGDLVILTAIGTVYPTSDHFHQVVTPAITIMARWLGLTTPQTAQDIVTGAYVGALCLKYQTLAKRYIPELVRFTVLCLKSPSISADLVETHVANLTAMASLWSDKPAFTEIFTPSAHSALKALGPSQSKAVQHLSILLSQARHARRPQELHHWRPQPIKTSIPKFEDNFNPDKHYDPDQERREAAKLKAEYRREKKGALRELRKDASFIAREKLREKKERDAAYEAKYKRLVAEIQGEEGREKNAYEREKKARKQSRR